MVKKQSQLNTGCILQKRELRRFWAPKWKKTFYSCDGVGVMMKNSPVLLQVPVGQGFKKLERWQDLCLFCRVTTEITVFLLWSYIPKMLVFLSAREVLPQMALHYMETWVSCILTKGTGYRNCRTAMIEVQHKSRNVKYSKQSMYTFTGLSTYLCITFRGSVKNLIMPT